VKRFFVLALAASFSAQAFAGGDPASGQVKAKQVCAACHGEAGNKPLQPDYPVLAGQRPDYIVEALKDYRSGARKNAIMGGMAQALSDKDIQDVAAWFSSQTGPLHVIR
jgi:cytochrome c553